MPKKREFQSSELVKSLAKIYGFEDVLTAFKIKDFLQEYLDEMLFNEIESVRIKNQILTLKIKSPLLKNDFRMRKSFYESCSSVLIPNDVFFSKQEKDF